MTDTVTRLLAIADVYADRFHEARKRHTAETAHDRSAARQLLEAELTRLFTPLSDEQIEELWPCPKGTNSIQTLFRICEHAHGIGGES